MPLKNPKMSGVDVAPRRPGVISDPGPTRRPPPGAVVKGTNPFLEATENPKGNQVKAPDSAPAPDFSKQNQGVIAAGGDYGNQQLGLRPGMQLPAQPVRPGMIPGGGFSGPNDATTGGFPTVAPSRAPTVGSAPGPRKPGRGGAI